MDIYRGKRDGVAFSDAMDGADVPKGKYGRLAIIVGTIVLADQLAKAAILQSVPLYRTIPVIPGFFNITHIHNPGGAFGFLADQHAILRNVVFLVVSLLALAVVLYFYHNTPKTHTVLAWGFAMIFGGAIGNLIDRLRFGEVVDFLDVYVGAYHWPAFNVADSAISVGIAIFIVHLLFKKMPD